MGVQVLKRINGQIEARRAAGEDLPPPPKTAIAGPEYFGLNQPEVGSAVHHLACACWLRKGMLGMTLDSHMIASPMPLPKHLTDAQHAYLPSTIACEMQDFRPCTCADHGGSRGFGSREAVHRLLGWKARARKGCCRSARVHTGRGHAPGRGASPQRRRQARQVGPVASPAHAHVAQQDMLKPDHTGACDVRGCSSCEGCPCAAGDMRLMTRIMRKRRKRGPVTGKLPGCSMHGRSMLTLPHHLQQLLSHVVAAGSCWRRWSAINRQARYKRRFEADAEAGVYVDADNPLPDFMDPVTLQPVVKPAMSQYGHVMGLQTWKVWKCPWPALCPVRSIYAGW